MKRSWAPSFKSHNQTTFHETAKRETNNTNNNDYQWGTGLNIRKRANHNNGIKRIFNVVWRDVTTKKHKTWKGDGILEVYTNTNKIILLNENGTYLSSDTNSNNNINDLQENVQMVVGNKEIEIQNEVLDTNDVYHMSNSHFSSLNWDKPQDSLTEMKKVPKGAFIFKSPLLLSNIKPTLTKKHVLESKCTEQSASVNEYICLVKSSELQKHLFRKMYDFYNHHQPDSIEVVDILQEICNHPSLLNHKSITNEIMRNILITSLPNWDDMGVFDSGKTEFIQQQIVKITRNEDQFVSVIVADNENVINMLQQLCTFLNIKCRRFQSDDNEEFLADFNVILLSTKECNQYIQIFLNLAKQIIAFENAHCLLEVNMFNVLSNARSLKNDIVIYYLITSFSIEDLLLYHYFCKTHFLNNVGEFFNEIIQISEGEDNNLLYSCYAGWKATRNTLLLSNTEWQYIPGPFPSDFFDSMLLNNGTDSLSAVFKKKKKRNLGLKDGSISHIKNVS